MDTKAKNARAFFYLKCLMAVWFGFFIYAALSICVGSKGLIVYRQLVQERERLMDNLEIIQAINNKLNIQNILASAYGDKPENLLPLDEDTILAETRKIGYGKEGEHLIHFIGISAETSAPLDAGKPEYAFRVKGIPDYVIKIISFVSASALFLCLILPDILGFIRYMREEEAKRNHPAQISS
jgi:hypothetical protein